VFGASLLAEEGGLPDGAALLAAETLVDDPPDQMAAPTPIPAPSMIRPRITAPTTT